jgi:quercetin dioxygenase-like cupin family protein
MIRSATIALSLAAVASIAPPPAFAENAPPTYQADPSVYKVIFEDENFRVIAATWKAGKTDKPHSHPVPSVVYAVTSCTLKLQAADGTTREVHPKRGTAMAVPITASHTATNTGPKTCRAVLVEHK